MRSDNELIKDFQSGQQAAFDELVKRHLSTVYTFFRRITGDDMAAEDLAQDVFYKLFKHLKKFRFDAEFTTYLFRVNINTASTYLRRSRWRNLLHLDEAPETSEASNENWQWSRTELWNAVARLPKQQRLVVIMRIAQEIPYKDIARILGTSESTAKVNYHHGVKKLKEQLGAK